MHAECCNSKLRPLAGYMATSVYLETRAGLAAVTELEPYRVSWNAPVMYQLSQCVSLQLAAMQCSFPNGCSCVSR